MTAMEPGKRYFATYKGDAFVAEVKEPKLVQLVEAGRRELLGAEAGGLSALGKRITGNAVTVGAFWSEGTPRPAKERTRAPAAAQGTTATVAAPRVRTIKVIKPARSQHGVEDGWTRWFCTDCMGGFIGPSKPAPEECPQGHPAVATDDLTAWGAGPEKEVEE